MLSAAYEARNADSANLDGTLAKRLMDKGICLRVSARKQMKRNRATHCPGHCTSASVTAAGDCADYLLFIRFLHVAQQAFVKADSFLRAAGLICGRLPAFFVAGFRVAAGLARSTLSLRPPSFHGCCYTSTSCGTHRAFPRTVRKPTLRGTTPTSNRARNQSL